MKKGIINVIKTEYNNKGFAPAVIKYKEMAKCSADMAIDAVYEILSKD